MSSISEGSYVSISFLYNVISLRNVFNVVKIKIHIITSLLLLWAVTYFKETL